MESNLKCRGFIKAKLTPFYRAATSFAIHHQVEDKQGFFGDSLLSAIHQEVSFFLPADKNRKNVSQIDTFFGVAGDKTVDIKAAAYISSVQERFKLERNKTERLKLQEITR